MKYIFHNKSLMERYEKLRASFLENKSYNMEQAYLMDQGMAAWITAWSDKMDLPADRIQNDPGRENKMPVWKYLNPELKDILVSLILSSVRS